MSQDPTPREMGHYLALAQVGMEMVLPATVGVFLDQWLDTVPWLTIVLAIFGFGGGLFHLISLLNRKQREESSGPKPPT